jgi:hypothetical protein
MIRRIAFVLALVPALAGAQESFDRTMVSKIRDEGLARSQAWGMVDTLATVIGPRLTASPAYMQAARMGAGPVFAGDDRAPVRPAAGVSRCVVVVDAG